MTKSEREEQHRIMVEGQRAVFKVCGCYTAADMREAFVAGWEDILEQDFDDGMKQLAEAEALRRWPDKEGK